MVCSASSWQKISSTWPCLTVRLFAYLLNPYICMHQKAHRPLGCAAVHSQSEAVRAVAECVWTHYLTVTGDGAERSLPPAQQQEVWVQYSALRIALQVREPLCFPQRVSLFWGLVLGWAHTVTFFMSTSFLRLISKAWKNTQVTRPSWACHTLDCFSHPSLRYCDSIVPEGSQLQMRRSL